MYSNAVIAAVINPPMKAIMGIVMMAPTPKIRLNQPKLKPVAVEKRQKPVLVIWDVCLVDAFVYRKLKW